MEEVEEEEGRKEGLEGRTTGTRTEAGDPAVIVREEEEVVVVAVVGMEGVVADPATAEVGTPTGAVLQVPRAAAEETMAARLMTGGEKRLEGDTHLSFSCIYIFYLVRSSVTGTSPAWPQASEGQDLVMCDFDRMFLP